MKRLPCFVFACAATACQSPAAVPTEVPTAEVPSASSAPSATVTSIASAPPRVGEPTDKGSACGTSPSDWCPAPPGDPCGAHPDVASCKADARCGGMPYRGESFVACKHDARGFGENCPTVGCVSRSSTPGASDER
jgi:hypothetical protein